MGSGRGKKQPPPPTTTTLFAGLVVALHHLPNASKVQELLERNGAKVLSTMRTTTGELRVRKAGALTPTHVVVDQLYLPPTLLGELRALGRGEAGVPLPVVLVHWLDACLLGKQILPVDAYLARPAGGEAAAAAEPAAKKARTASSGKQQCGTCGTELAATEIAFCWDCMRDKPVETRMLHLRFKIEHHNAGLVAALRELAAFEGLFPTRDDRSADAFNWAAAALMATPGEVTSASQLSEWDPPFVGAEGKIRKQYIPEWLRTGKIERLETHRRDAVKVATRLFNRIPYVTKTMAKEWAAQGFTTFSDVWAAHERGALQPPLDTDWLLLAVRHGDELSSVMSPAESEPLLEFILAKLQAACPSGMRDGLRWTRVGGASRGKAASHDLDVLATHDVEGTDRDMVNTIVRLIVASDALERDPVTGKPCLQVMLASPSESCGGGGDAFAVGAAAIWQDDSGRWQCAEKPEAFKAQMLLKLKGKPLRQVDILVVPRSQWAFYVLAWVGSREMEKLLKRHVEYVLNLKLGSRSLYARDDTFVVAADGTHIPMVLKQRDYVEAKRWPREEVDIWPMIGLPYRPPCDRNC